MLSLLSVTMVIGFGLESGESLNTGTDLEREEGERKRGQLLERRHPWPSPTPHPPQGRVLSRCFGNAFPGNPPCSAGSASGGYHGRLLLQAAPGNGSLFASRELCPRGGERVGWVLRASASSGQAFLDSTPSPQPTPKSWTDPSEQQPRSLPPAEKPAPRRGGSPPPRSLPPSQPPRRPGEVEFHFETPCGARASAGHAQ